MRAMESLVRGVILARCLAASERCFVAAARALASAAARAPCCFLIAAISSLETATDRPMAVVAAVAYSGPVSVFNAMWLRGRPVTDDGEAPCSGSAAGEAWCLAPEQDADHEHPDHEQACRPGPDVGIQELRGNAEHAEQRREDHGRADQDSRPAQPGGVGLAEEDCRAIEDRRQSEQGDLERVQQAEDRVIQDAAGEESVRGRGRAGVP